MNAFALLASACIALAGQDTPTCNLYRIPDGVAPPKIDGELDDPVWRDASSLGALTQVEPIEGAPPSEEGDVRICYDAHALYVMLDCRDREPDKIRATQMYRDANLDPDERVEILIDPFLDRRNAFWFQIGAAGSLGDALITRNGASFNKQWDGIWFARARITERGWQAEMAIPFATLNFAPDGTQWGFNLRRFIRRRTEEVRWASPRLNVSFFSVANAGTLCGLHDLRQGLGLDVKPFGVVHVDRDHTLDDTNSEGDVGFDAFYKLSPDTKLALSVNTDFAETEVDARQVNLTRFPLFFPEKRDFFLEDSGVFQFGSPLGFNSPQDVIPFFSRRIGLDANGHEVPILAATKLTSQTDSYGVGVLDVQTDDTTALDGTNLFATRFTKNVFEQSDVGVIWTHGNPSDPDVKADTYGVDVNLRTDDFLGHQNLRWSSYVVQTPNADAGSGDVAWSSKLSYPNDVWQWDLGYTEIENDFDPKLGFVPRAGIRKHEGTLAYAPRLNTWVRQLTFAIDPTWITDVAGNTETFQFELQPLGCELESGDSGELRLIRQREVLDTPFDIHSNVTIPVGDYTFDRTRLALETSDKRDLSGTLTLEGGEFFDGDSTSIAAGLQWRSSRYFLFGTDVERSDVDLPGGAFIVDVVRARTDVVFSPDVSWTTIVQWDDDSELIGMNSRLWWIFQAGNEAFLVLNQGWTHEPQVAPTTTEVALKFGYTFRF